MMQAMIDIIKIGQYLVVDLSSKKLQLINDAKSIALNADIGICLPQDANHEILYLTDNDLTVTWSLSESRDSVINLKISLNAELSSLDVQVYNIEWKTTFLDEISDSFELAPYHWYGGSESYHQQWPIETDSRPMWTYTTADIYQPGYGNVMERYWLCSSRTALSVEEDVPLLISIDRYRENRLRLLSRYSDTIYANFNVSKSGLSLSYKLWLGLGGQNLKTFHEYIVKNIFQTPRGTPDHRMISEPIWTTWARYKTDINEEKVVNFVGEIFQHNFQCSQIEIDDGWASKHGDLEFDFGKFPNPKRMIENLHKDYDVRVTLWIHPFANLDSKTANDSNYANFWVRRRGGGEPVVVEWWNGKAYVLDVTNPEAKKWFSERLKDFQIQFSIDSFKFDAGEVNWLGDNFQLHDAKWPNVYTTEYANMARDFGSMVEARCNSKNQNAGNFLRIMDKDSRWGYDNGLKTLIPCALLFGVLNRPYVLPDIIGGNAYAVDGRPDRELFVRWAQACAFMPAVQFSVTPWDYDETCAEIVRNAVALRRRFVAGELTEKEISISDDSIIQMHPLWWTGDDGEEALTCDDEFTVGDKILVAPILEKGRLDRSVYLPRGYNWKGALDDRLYEGGQTIVQRASLDEIPLYFRV